MGELVRLAGAAAAQGRVILAHLGIDAVNKSELS
jgi:hypothetical protein